MEIYRRLSQDDEEEVGTPIYNFKVRVNLDKLWEINQIKETFKAQYFLHAHLDYDKEKEEVVKEDMRWLEERLAIENSVELYNHDTYKPKVTVGNGRVDVRWLIRGEFGESLELQDFPFDTQELKITIKVGLPCRKDKPLHKFTDVGKSKVILNVFPLVNTWEPPRNVTLDYSLSDKRRNFLKDRFPLLTVTVTVTRFPWYHLWNISLPLGSIVVMSWSSFTIDAADKAGRLSASLTLVLTAVAYKYIVAQMVPHISYNTLLDKYILTCWLFLFLVVIENCFAEQVQDEIAVALTFGISFLLYNICFWTYGCMVYQARNVRQSDIDMNLDDSSDDSDEETQC